MKIKNYKKNCLHTPIHPFYKLDQEIKPEIFSPSVVNPNIVKSGSQGIFTMSAHEIEVIGVTMDLAVFRCILLQNLTWWWIQK